MDAGFIILSCVIVSCISFTILHYSVVKWFGKKKKKLVSQAGNGMKGENCLGRVDWFQLALFALQLQMFYVIVDLRVAVPENYQYSIKICKHYKFQRVAFSLFISCLTMSS